ncbi:3-deoxy-D-manno-octulosonic acid transferase [Parvibium lacunae]|uniref:3-deoxy-D-manno-octulosonic acid transferase n=1 Tax=Parvibium lacunae TaxID=1888893 RepID=A0A368L217_9BURK|nr:3-deoxy-D-manno-octulosonic acid transferase [Parvibium lacunae]
MARSIYCVCGWLLTPIIILYLLWRARRQPEYLQHWAERWGMAIPRQDTFPLIWLHAVSVGETRAAQPLLQRLFESYPTHRFLLTHMTPTGRATSHKLFAAFLAQTLTDDQGQTVPRLTISYLPYDFLFAVRRFFKTWRPDVLLLMETELWPNLIHTAAARGCKTALINARLSEKSLRKLRRFHSLAQAGIGKLDVLAAQTYPDAARLQSIVPRDIAVTGNLKFDIWPTRQQQEAGQQLRQQIAPLTQGSEKPRSVLLLASTREGEEALLLTAYAEYIHQGWLVIVVPRHPQRFEAVAQWLKMHGLVYQRRSEGQVIGPDCQVLLGDTMGEMFAYYEACDVAFIGGSLLPLGGQNLIEACAVGRPVLVGPHTFNFAEATAQAIEAGAALRVPDAEAVFLKMQHLEMDPALRETMSKAALAFSQRHRGATQRTLDVLTPLLAQAAQPQTLAAPSPVDSEAPGL